MGLYKSKLSKVKLAGLLIIPDTARTARSHALGDDAELSSVYVPNALSRYS